MKGVNVARFIDPFQEMDRIRDAFGTRAAGAVMPMDAFEKGGIYTLRFDLAGADPDRVDVTVEGGTLTVQAERPVEDTEGVNWLARERPTGSHSRQVRLGDTLDVDAIEASYNDGVLTVTIPSRPEAQPHKVSITTGGRRAVEG